MEVVKSIRKDKKNAAGMCPIRITAYWNGNRAFFATGESCKPEHWQADKQRVSTKDPYHLEKNRVVGQLAERITESLYKAVTDGARLTAAQLRERVLGKPRKAEKPTPAPPASEKTFSELWRDFVEYKRREMSAVTGERVSHATIKGYRSTLKKFEDFERAQGKIELKTLDKRFYNDFYNFVLDSGQGLNYFGKLISRLKTFLGWCEENEIEVSTKWRKFAKPERYVGVEALSESELLALRSLEPRREYQRTCLDMFLFACSTGLHISDVLKITESDIRDGVLYLERTKTRHRCVIPLMEDNAFCARSIYERYKGGGRTLFPNIYGQLLNPELKELFAQAGITRVNPVFKLGRKTFVTILLYRGVATRMIMQMTGHKDEKSFSHYAGVNVESLKKMLGTHPSTHP